MSNKIGRNEKCPCGSGLKYKKCCMNKQNTDHFNYSANRRASMPKILKIEDPYNNCFYRVIMDDCVEKVNPIEYYQNFRIENLATNLKDDIEIKYPELAKGLTPQFYVNTVHEYIENGMIPFDLEECHKNFFKVLETTRKKDQVSLLKGVTINPQQLYFLITEAYQKHSYLYSRYRFETLPEDLKNEKIPIVAELKEDDSINSIGSTDLSDGEIKRMLEQRKVIVAHFLDRGENWHCLFTTYNSLGGKENYKSGQPHFHYISNAFGISREDFIESMKNGKYKATSIHIDLLDYGNQPNGM